MKTYQIKTNAPDETMAVAENLSKKLRPGDVLTLDGDLGAGKTTFTKGLAKGLGIKRIVNSPTFTIIKEYHGRLPLYHMDVYRLEDGAEDLGFEEYIDGEGVTVVEWADLIKDQLPAEYLKITIHRVDDRGRTFVIEPIGERFTLLCKELFKHESFSD